MKKIGLWCWLLTKRQLKSIFFLFILLLIPVTAFVTARMEGFNETEEIRVALYARDNDELAANTINDLLKDTDCYIFYLCASEEDLIQAVQTGEAECGYIFVENITNRVAKEKYKNNIIQVKKTGSFLADSINETIFSSFFKFFTREMMLNYVKNSEKFSQMDQEGLVQLDGTYDYYLNDNGTFHVEFKMLGDGTDFLETEIIETEDMTFPLRNVMSVLVMLGAVLGVLNWQMDKEAGVFAPMKYDFVTISRPLYVAIPTVLLAVCAFCSMAVSRTMEFYGREFAVMAAYVILLTATGVLATYVIRKSTWIVSALPVLMIGSLILCPVFIDLSVYIPVLKYAQKLFLPYYYMIMF